MDLPNNWKRKQVGDAFIIQLGKMLNQKAKHGDSQYPYLANFNVRWGSLDLSQLNRMNFSMKEQTKFELKAGDLLMCEGGEIGRCAILKEDLKGVFYQKALHRLRPKDGSINQEFFYFYMSYISDRGVLPRLVGETSIAHLTKEKLVSLTFPYPPIIEQKAIAEILSTWDEAIEKAELLLVQARLNYRAKIQQIIDTQESKWERANFADLFETVSDKNHPDEELLSATQERGVIPRYMLSGRVMTPEGSLSSYKLIYPGDFAVSLRSFQGGLELSEYRGLISPAYTVLRPRMEIDQSFFKHFFKSYLFIRKYLDIAVIGIRDGKQVSIPDLLTIKIPVPSLADQVKIGSYLDSAKEEERIRSLLIDKLKTQKRGLMQKLLTGQWRVKLDKGA